MKRKHVHAISTVAAAIAAVVFLLVYMYVVSQPKTVTSELTVSQEIIEAPSVVGSTSVAPPPPLQYIEIIDSCGPYYNGSCVRVRTGPGSEYPVVMTVRNGMVLKVDKVVMQDGQLWYKIGFDGFIRYPERVTNDWYVSGDYARLFTDKGVEETTLGLNASSTKRIIVNRTKEMLYAYDGDTLFMEEPISVGLELTPTPRGTFWVYKKTPDAYMQGPLPGVSDQYYDLPGVPWDLYFTFQGGAIHGAYWHNHFGEPWSHGCVNLPTEQAKKLYEWADVGTPVTVHD